MKKSSKQSEIEEAKALLEQRKKALELQLLRQKELKLPFHERLKLPHNEKRLQRIENQQREIFERIIQKRYPELRPEVNDLFAEFMLGFLKGDYLSIDDYLKKNHEWDKRKKAEWFVNQ